ncbi:hypothetical protein CHELA17_62542 [Chelatococcus asaccharovorans]|nr:hypothetical protein CHELA17_62542 [Chelatococcus asaccharovorans]
MIDRSAFDAVQIEPRKSRDRPCGHLLIVAWIGTSLLARTSQVCLMAGGDKAEGPQFRRPQRGVFGHAGM